MSPLVRSIRKTIAPGLISIVCLVLLTAAILLYLGWDATFATTWGWFINFVNQGWFGFVLACLVMLLLVVLGVRRLWRWFRPVGTSVGTLLIVGIAIFAIMKSYSPAGIYTNLDEYGRDYDHYWLLANGEMKDVSREGRLHYGRYEKTSDGWILTRTDLADRDLFKSKLKFSVFGISLTDPEDPQAALFVPRRIIPFVRPKWMPNWLQ